MFRSFWKFGRSYEDLITIFIGYIRPILEYATQVWSGGLTGAQRQRLERLQKCALRIIFRKDYHSYATNLNYKHWKVVEMTCVTFFKKTLSCTDQFKQSIPQRVHNRTLRRANKIPEPRCKTKRTCMWNSLIPDLIRLYNKSFV